MSEYQENTALAFAQRFIAPGAHENDAEEISKRIAEIPTPFLEALAQHGVKIRLLHENERYDELSPHFSRYLEATVPQSERTDILADLRGLYVPGEKTAYVMDPQPGTLVHELGHALDHALGSTHYNSRTDRTIITAYAAGETFSPAGSENERQAFAEWFRAYCSVQIPGVDSTIDIRQHAQEKSPTALAYFNALERAVVLALEKDPKAFEPGSSFDRKHEVVVAAQIAATLGIPVEKTPSKELLFQGEQAVPGALGEVPQAYDPTKDTRIDGFQGSHSLESRPEPATRAHDEEPSPQASDNPAPFAIESKTERTPTARPFSGMTSHVHENGDVSYRFNDLRSRALGKNAFRDCGSKIHLEGKDARSMSAAVAYAKESWGDAPVILRLAPEVRETVLREAVKVGLKVQNPELQADIQRIRAERAKSPFTRHRSEKTVATISRAPELTKTH